jgi:hypothetical protein
MNLWIASTILVIALGVSPPPAKNMDEVDSQPSPQADPANTPLKEAVRGIWQDAAVDSDQRFAELFKGADFTPVAPDNMRSIIVSWPQPRSMRGRMHALAVNIKDESLTFRWSGEIGSGDKFQAAHQRFADHLRTQGYRPLDKAGQEAFLKRDGDPRDDQREVWMRVSGSTELLVSFESESYIGSKTFHSGLLFEWYARRPWRLPPPTLSETFAVLPPWMKPKYLNETFFTAMANEPILQLQSGHGFSFQLANPVVEQLIKALEQAGFEYDREHSLRADGGVQKSWSRFTDTTFSHIVTAADGKQLRFSCQAPQRKGPPLTVKPLPKHPSLRLPLEKRPILKFDQLVFADPVLRQQARLFHDLAEQSAEKTWQRQGYRDEGNSPSAKFEAKWETSTAKSLSFLKKDLPYQGITITLEGSRDAPEQIGTLHVRGMYVPQQGWAAMVSYQRFDSANGTGTSGIDVRTKLVTDHEIPIDITQSSVQVLSYRVSGSARKGQLVYDFERHSGQPDFQTSLHTLYDSPETLRDAALAMISEFCKTTCDMIQAGESITVYDKSYVRSDNPPNLEPADPNQLTDAIKQSIRENVEKQLANQEASIRNHYQAIHAAIQRALPLADLQQTLLKESPTAPAK